MKIGLTLKFHAEIRKPDNFDHLVNRPFSPNQLENNLECTSKRSNRATTKRCKCANQQEIISTMNSVCAQAQLLHNRIQVPSTASTSVACAIVIAHEG